MITFFIIKINLKNVVTYLFFIEFQKESCQQAHLTYSYLVAQLLKVLHYLVLQQSPLAITHSTPENSL